MRKAASSACTTGGGSLPSSGFQDLSFSQLLNVQDKICPGHELNATKVSVMQQSRTEQTGRYGRKQIEGSSKIQVLIAGRSQPASIGHPRFQAQGSVTRRVIQSLSHCLPMLSDVGRKKPREITSSCVNALKGRKQNQQFLRCQFADELFPSGAIPGENVLCVVSPAGLQQHRNAPTVFVEEMETCE